MLDKGVDKVRGAGLTHDRDYTLQDEDLLVRTIGHALDLEFDELRRRIRPQLLINKPVPLAAQSRDNAPFAGGGTALQRGEEWECPFCPHVFGTFEARAAHVPTCMQAVYGTDCYRCGRNGHWQDDCQYVTDVDNDPIEDVWECQGCHREFDIEQQAACHVEGCAVFARGGGGGKRSRTSGSWGGAGGRSDGGPQGGSSDGCFRCGRDSHWVSDCYARTHINGSRLN
jgi:hypothetical protein